MTLRMMLRVTLALLIVLLFICVLPIQAASIAVACDSPGLIVAITAANNSPTDDTLELASGCTYTFADINSTPPAGPNSLPIIANNGRLTIHGNGASIVRSFAANTPDFRLFYVSSGATLTLDNLTLSNGHVSGRGGALYNDGAVTLTRSTVTGSSADNGGGLYNSPTGTMTVRNGVVSDNHALVNDTRFQNTLGSGAGIFNDGMLTLAGSAISSNHADNRGGGVTNTNTAVVTNTTISGNDAASLAGGFFNTGTLTVTGSTFSANRAIHLDGGALYNYGAVTMTNTTISGNTAYFNGGALGNQGVATLIHTTVSDNGVTSFLGTAGLYSTTTSVILKNTILANNVILPPVNVETDCFVRIGPNGEPPQFTSYGVNLISHNECGTSVGGGFVMTNTDAKLLALADNGGTTQTVALEDSSPAIDAAADCSDDADNDPGTGSPLATDQRGFARPGGVRCDLGAYEHTVDGVIINQSPTQADPASDSPILFNVTFSLPVTGFGDDPGDVTLGGIAGATTAEVSGSGANYTVSVSGMTQDGTVTVSIPAGVAQVVGFSANTASTSVDNSVIYDTTAPTVTIEQADTQADPTHDSTIHFTVVFSEPVADFDPIDVDLSGTAAGTLSAAVSPIAPDDGTTYDVAVSGIAGNGTVIAAVHADAAHDAAGKGNLDSTSSDNEVTYTAPTVTVDQADTQDDPTAASPILFTVVFSDSVTGFGDDPADVTLGGTAGAATAEVSGSGTTYTVSVSGMIQSGTVTVAIPAGAAERDDSAANLASTSTDDTIGYFADCSADMSPGDVASLINAIHCANLLPGDDTITLTPGTTYTLTSVDNSSYGNTGLPLIENNGSLTINGNGAKIVRASGGATPAFRLLYVGSGAVLALNHLTLSNGQSDVYGAGVYNEGTLTLTGVTVSGNQYTGFLGGGGGLHNVAGGTMTITDSTITGNKADANPGYTMSGGGVNNSGLLTVTNSTISGNSANFGGGIANGNTATVTNSTISGNHAVRDGGGLSNVGILTLTGSTISGNTADRKGAGLYTESTATLLNSTVSGNQSADEGGGVYNAGSLNLTFSTVSANTMTGFGNGAGIYTDENTGHLTIKNSIVSNNRSLFDGGSERDCQSPLLTAYGVSIIVSGGGCFDPSHPDGVIANLDPGLMPLANNGGPTQTMALQSGGLAIDPTDVAADCTTDADNDPDTGDLLATDQRGEARPIDGNGDDTADCDLGAYELVPNSVIINQAVTQADPTTDAPVAFTVIFGSPVTGFGDDPGDVVLSGTAGATTAEVTGSGTTYTVTVSGMTASGTLIAGIPAGAAQVADLSGNTESTSNDNTVEYLLGCSASMTIADTDIDGLKNAIHCANVLPGDQTINLASGGVYEFLGIDNGVYGGNALPVIEDNGSLTINGNGARLARVAVDLLPFRMAYVAAGASLTLNDLKISGGKLQNESGGAIYNDGESLTLNNVQLTDNQAFFGGALYSYGSSTISVSGSTISRNKAYGGGAFDLHDANLTISDSTFENNSITFTPSLPPGYNFKGGAIRASDSDVSITGSTISSNSARDGGGGIELRTGTLTISDSTIGGNSTGINGGGIESPTGTVSISGSTVSGNSAQFKGGGIYFADGTLTVTDSTLSSNTATESVGRGGGIYLGSQAVATVTGSTLVGNSADAGSGVFVDGSAALTATNSTFTGNTGVNVATSTVIYNGSQTTLINSTIASNLGGVITFSGTLNLKNSILANNTGGDCAPFGVVFGGGANLIEDGGCLPVGSVNLTVDPMLDSLADNGGPTETMALQPGSPALDATADCTNDSDNNPNTGSPLATDQRGIARPLAGDSVGGALCDLGAYEAPAVPGVTLEQAADQADPAFDVPIHFTAVFNEPVADFADGDVTVTGTAGVTAATVAEIAPFDKTTYDVVVNEASVSGTVIVSIAADVAHNAAGVGNSSSVSSDNLVTYQGGPPAVTIEQAAGQADPTISGPIHFTVVFTKPVIDFNNGRILSLDGGSASPLLSAVITPSAPFDGTTYDVAVSGMYNSGPITVNLLAGVVHDADGQENAYSTSIDNTVYYAAQTPPGPQPLIERNGPSPTGAPLAHFVVTFNRPVNDFTESDVAVSGTAGATTASISVDPKSFDGRQYFVDVSGMTHDGTVIITVPAGVAHDGDGLPNVASANRQNSIDYDTTGPTVTVDQAADQDDPTTSATIHFTAVFNEPAQFFDGVPLTFGGTVSGTLHAVITPLDTPPFAKTFDIAVTGMSGDGTVTLSIPDGSVPDFAGNFNVASTSTDNEVTYQDVVGPSVTVEQAAGQNDPTAATEIHFTAAFSEPVSDFTSEDVTVGGTADHTGVTVTETDPHDGTTYDITVSGVTSDGTVIVTIPAEAVHDALNNVGSASTSVDNVVTRDTVGPTVTVEQAQGQDDPASGFSIHFLVTFNKPVVDFFDGSVLTLGGTVSGHLHAIIDMLPPPDGTTYVVTVTGMSGNGTVTLSVPAGIAHDSVGNTNSASNNIDNSVTYQDTTRPTIFISPQVPATNTSPIHFTATFSEPVSDFGAGDVRIDSATGADTATVTEIDPHDGTTYDIAVSGMTADGEMNITIPDNVAHDVANNGNLAAISFSPVNYDATGPAVTIEKAAGQSDPTGNANIHFTVTFSEPAPAFFFNGDSSKLKVGGTAPGTLNVFVNPNPPFDFTSFDVSISGMTGVGSVTLSLDADSTHDEAGNGNTASTSSDNAVLYIDPARPTVTLEQAVGQLDPVAVSPIHFTATFSEPVVDFGSSAVTLTGTAGATTATVTEIEPNDGTTYDVSVSSMTQVGTVTASIADGVVHNSSGTGSNPSYSADNTVTFISCPTFPISLDDGDVDGLIEAINCANALPGDQTINLAADGLYTLSVAYQNAGQIDAVGLPPIIDAGALTINGNGATITRSASDDVHRFGLLSVESAHVMLDHLALTNGSNGIGAGLRNEGGTVTLTHSTISGAMNVTAASEGMAHGGGIYNHEGTLTLIETTVSNNDNGELPQTSAGGGIYNDGGTVSLISSTISGNRAINGAGLYNLNGGTATIINSTISGNRGLDGAGLLNEGATATLVNSTVSDNIGTAVSDFSGGQLTLKHTILANSQFAPDCMSEPGSTVTSVGVNLIENNGCTLDGDGTLLTDDPQLAPLANNGGPTQTMALLPGSPAIDAAADCTDTDSNTVTTDQRGVTRPIDGDDVAGEVCDLGAYEASGHVAVVRQADGQADPTVTGPILFTVTFNHPVTGFGDETSDVTLGGTAGATTAEVSGSDATYTVAVSGMTQDGTVTVEIPAGAAVFGDSASNDASINLDNSVTYDPTGPTVTVDQADTQADPTSISPVRFTAVFSEPVNDFDGGDVHLGGTAPGTLSASVSPLDSDGKLYAIAVSGMTDSGTVEASIDENVLHDLAGNSNAASTSTDNSVTFNFVPRSVTVEQASTQADPTSASSIDFTVVFSAPVTGFGDKGEGVDLSASTAPGSLAATITPVGSDGTTFTVSVTGMTGLGTVVVSVPAGAGFYVDDSAGTPASTSTDNSVTYAADCSSNMTVANNDVAGLIHAINCANALPSNDIISLTPGDPYTLTEVNNTAILLGTNGLPIIVGNGSLTLNGNGATIARSDVDGTPEFQLLCIASGAMVSINDLTLSNGRGGILSKGTLTVTNTTLSGNQSSGGSGIYNAGTLTVIDSTFSHNTSLLAGGGGILNDAQASMLTVTNTTFSGNQAPTGGGIYNLGTLTVTGSTFSNNSASFKGGGGIFNTGTLTVTDSTFSGNTVSSSLVQSKGGGIASTGTLTVTNSTLTGNSVAIGGVGGGIFVEDATTNRLVNSTLSGNLAGSLSQEISAGIGEFTLKNNVIDGTLACRGFIPYQFVGANLFINSACGPFSSDGVLINADPLLGPLQDNGGPTQTMALLPGSPAIDVVTDCTDTDSNTISTDQRGVARPIDGNGDDTPVCDLGAYEAPEPVFVTIEQASTQADPAATDPIDFTVVFSAPVSGFDDASTDVDLSLSTAPGTLAATITPVGSDNTTFTVSVSGMSGDGDVIAQIPAGAATSIEDDTAAAASTSTDNSVTYVADCSSDTTVANNDVAGLIHAINCANALSSDDSISLTSGDPYTLSDVDNTHADGANGLPVIVDNGSLTLNGNGATIARSDVDGTPDFRIFYVEGGASLTLQNLTMTGGHVSDGYGGGIYNNGGTVALTDSTLTGNRAQYAGGLYNVDGAEATLTDVRFNSNGASAYGGGLLNAGTLTATDVAFNENDAGTLGGGLFNGGSATLTNTTVSGNFVSTGNGGGLFNSGSLSLINVTISGNSATTKGGGLYNQNSAILINTTVSDNGANSGGGVWSDDELTLKNSILANSNNGVDCVRDDGTIESVGVNLIQRGSSCLSSGTALTGDPLLNGLADNGGSTQTMALRTGSSAIDAATDCTDLDSNIITTDQRGVNRPIDGNADGTADCDLGAYEAAVPPTVIINQADTQADPTNAASIDFTVAFSLPMTGFDDPTADVDLSLSTASGTLTATITPVGSDNTTFTVSVSGMTGDGDVIAQIPIGAAQDDAGTLNVASTSDDNSVSYDGTAPTVTNVTASPSTGAYTFGGIIDIQITFSEPVTVTGTPQLTLETGSHDAVVDYSGGSDSDTLTFSYNVELGDTSEHLDYASDSALKLNGGTINDATGNPATLTLAAPGATGSLAANTTLVIDTDPPTTSIDSGPSDTVNDNTPTFEFSSETGATFECRIDSDSFASCTSPYTVSPALDDGPHTFEVQATDTVGNTEDVPASQSFTVDTTPPTTDITDGPIDRVNDNTPTFEFSSEDGATFECRIDSDSFAGCTSPYTVNPALDDGEHTFEVRATDAVGNTETSPASQTFTVDTTGPTTTIDDGPSGTTGDTTPTFEFSSETGASFQCQIDGGGFFDCSSPYTVDPSLSDDEHTFEVQATDDLGNTGAPDSRTFTVDSTAPTVTIDSGPSGTVNDNTPTFEFSSETDASFECRIDSSDDADFAACSSPYTVDPPLDDDEHTFDVRAVDAVGNPGTPDSRTFTVDTTPPVTTIDDGPSGTVNDNEPRFYFSSEDGATFECQIDSGGFFDCSSPYTVDPRLDDGPHTFEVQATDTVGNVETTPASQSFSVDTTPPTTTITDGPVDATRDTTPTFKFTSETGATFQCRVDSKPFANCTSPYTVSPALDDGPHTFEVQATDTVGNTEYSPAFQDFSVDTTGPTTTIDDGPTGTVSDDTPTFEFSSESGASFECQIDDGGFFGCSSPYTVDPPLSDDEHTFEVRAIDDVDNTGAPDSRTFTVDTTGPATTIDDGPTGPVNDDTPTFEFSSEDGASFECRVDSSDDADFAACSSPYTVSPALDDGPHTFDVRATDTVGNTGAPDSRTFTVDTTPPTVNIDAGPSGTVKDNTPTFEFSSETGATLECRIDSTDAADFAACSSPYTVNPALTDDSHTFDVRAVDSAGNAGTPDSRTFTVDTTAPPTTIDVGPSGTVKDSAPTFEFSSETGAAFECRIDSTDDADFAACSSPFTVSPALDDGGHTFDVRATDRVGNTGTAASRTFTVDTTPPLTIITSGPTDTVKDNAPTFEFGSEGGASFECRIDSSDDADFASCSSPYTISPALDDGPHTFEVRATDTVGNVETLPASQTFTVDTTAPTTSIDDGPSGTVKDSAPTFEFSSETGASFECRIDSTDDADFVSCSSPYTVSPALSDAQHTFEVRATDAVGNTGTAASRTFTVDSTGPTTTIDVGPTGTTNDDTPTFEFSSETGASFECRIDSSDEADFAACTSPFNIISALSEAEHTFEVRATDTVGNTGTPASRTFTVDTSGPATDISAGPDGVTNDNTPTFEFSSETGATFECRIDSSDEADFAACSSLYTVDPALDDGDHTFEVRATDSHDNVETTPASRSFTVDTVGPTVTVEQASDQDDPALTAPIHFTVTFGEPVDDFGGGDVSLSGDAGATTATVTEIAPNDGTTYDVAASGMTGSGEVTAGVAADAAHDAAGNGNQASTSTDNTVTFAPVAPVVTGINRADANPTDADSVHYTVSFSAAVDGVDESDFDLTTTGLSGASVTDVSGSGSSYTVTVDTGSGSGTLRLDLIDDDTIEDIDANPLGGAGLGNGDFEGQVYTIRSDQSGGGSSEQPNETHHESSPTPDIPVENFEATNLENLTHGSIKVGAGNSVLNGVSGGIYATILALDGTLGDNGPAIGDADVLAQGVVQAINLYGLLPGGVPTDTFAAPVQVCMRGTGSILWLHFDPATQQRVVTALPSTQNGGDTCADVPGAGVVVLVGTPVPVDATQPPPTEQPPTLLTDCQVTTQYQVHLRAGAGTDSAVLDTVPYNLTLTATAAADGWIEVTFGDQHGWISADLLSTEGECGQ